MDNYQVLDKTNFQASIEGEKTDLFLLENQNLKVFVTNYGARIVSLIFKNRFGQPLDVVLGFKSINDYLKAISYTSINFVEIGFRSIVNNGFKGALARFIGTITPESLGGGPVREQYRGRGSREE